MHSMYLEHVLVFDFEITKRTFQQTLLFAIPITSTKKSAIFVYPELMLNI